MQKNIVLYLVIALVLVLGGFLAYRYTHTGWVAPSPAPSVSASATTTPSAAPSASAQAAKLPTPPSDWDAFSVKDSTLDSSYISGVRADFDARVALLRKEPDSFNDWLSLGNDKKMVGDYSGAKDIYVYSGILRPLNSISFANLGDLEMNFLHDNSAAEAAYLTAVKNAGSDDPSPIRNLIGLYHALGKSDQEKSTIEEAITLFPKDDSFLVLMARWYESQNNKALAIVYLQKAVQLNPQNTAAQQELDSLQGK